MTNGKRGAFLTVMAVLFSILTVSNLTKAIQFANNPTASGIVIFGARFESVVSNLILGPLVGLLTGAYAYGLWKRRPWVVPISIFYAFYVPVNLVLFWHRQTSPDIPPVAGILVYLLFALGGSIGTALYLAYRRDEVFGAGPRG